MINKLKNKLKRTLNGLFEPIRRYNRAQNEKDKKVRDSYINSIPPEKRNAWYKFDKKMRCWRGK